MIAFGHPDNVLSLSKALEGLIDFELIFFVSGDLFEEGVLSIPLKKLDYGLNSHQASFEALPGNIKKYLGNDFKIRIFRSYDLKVLKDKRLRNLRRLIPLACTIRKQNYDLIHFNGTSGFMLPLIIFLRRFRKIWTLHDYINHTGEENKKTFMFQKFIISFNFHFIQHYSYLRDQLIRFYNLPEEKVSYIPSGPLTVFEAFEPEFLIPSNVKYILFFGRISKYKGIDYLITAFNQISPAFSEVNLVIAGRGEFWFEPVNNKNIKIFNRYIKTSELTGLIKNSLFVVLPYTDATHSAVVATSFTFLKPIIATNVGGLPEIIKDGFTGFLVPPKDSNELANKMEQLISTPKLLEDIQNNVQIITTSGEYSWSQIVRKMEKFYSSVLSEGQ